MSRHLTVDGVSNSIGRMVRRLPVGGGGPRAQPKESRHLMFKKLALATVATMVFVVPSVAGADVVTDWNRTMVGALVTAASPPPLASRDAAIVQASVFDAVNGIARRYTPSTCLRRPRLGPRGAQPQPVRHMSRWLLCSRCSARCSTSSSRDARSDRSTR